jgi:hypothetical protein
VSSGAVDVLIAGGGPFDAGSPVVWSESSEPVPDLPNIYEPSASPGRPDQAVAWRGFGNAGAEEVIAVATGKGPRLAP